MKKLTLLVATLTISLTGFTQAIPNNGFETWSTETQTAHPFFVPAHWTSSDELINVFNTSYAGVSVSQTSSSYSGTYAVLMQTAINNGDTVNGSIFSTDSLSYIVGNALGGNYGLGFPDAVRSASLQGYYKFTGVGKDSVAIGVALTKWNNISKTRDTLVKSVMYIGANAGSYTLFNLPLVYLINYENPDSAYIGAAINGPNGKNSHVGTSFYLDALAFNGTVPLGINELPDADKKVSIYPNPFSSSATLTINATISADNNTIEICNVLGQTVRTITNVNTSSITIERGSLQSGIYFYRLINAGNLVSTGKFIVE
jgi:hypothetical protein